MALKKATTKDVSVAARITAVQANRLDEVQSAEPALLNRSAAIGRLIDMMTAADFDALDAAEGKENTSNNVFDKVVAKEVLETLNERTRSYNELAKQVRAVGNNLNQLVRLGHQVALYGKDGEIAVESIYAIARQHEDILVNELHRLAAQDAHVESVVRACQPL